MTEHLAVQAGTLTDLRPFKTRPQPVYPDLVDRLCRNVAAPSKYDPTAAYVCAVLSAWSYSDANVVSTMMVRLGLQQNRCRYIGLLNDAMFVCSKAYFVQSACGRLGFLVYRGTEPVNLVSWLTDIDVKPTKLPVRPVARDERPAPETVPMVHGGFYRNQRATWFDVAHALDVAQSGRSVLEDLMPVPNVPRQRAAVDGLNPKLQPLEALYVTGHSLGGAMAAIAAFRLAHDDDFERIRPLVRGVYTYGQPMVGNQAWATLCEQDDRYALVTSRLFRHVFEHDVVPALPPVEAGSFAHTGVERRSETAPDDAVPEGASAGKCWASPSKTTEQMSLIELPGAFAAFAEAELEAGKSRPRAGSLLLNAGYRVESLLARLLHVPYSIYDHSPVHYMLCSQLSESIHLRQAIANEFGDF